MVTLRSKKYALTSLGCKCLVGTLKCLILTHKSKQNQSFFEVSLFCSSVFFPLFFGIEAKEQLLSTPVGDRNFIFLTVLPLVFLSREEESKEERKRERKSAFVLLVAVASSACVLLLRRLLL